MSTKTKRFPNVLKSTLQEATITGRPGAYYEKDETLTEIEIRAIVAMGYDFIGVTNASGKLRAAFFKRTD